jgi:hypothetical protein
MAKAVNVKEMVYSERILSLLVLSQSNDFNTRKTKNNMAEI